MESIFNFPDASGSSEMSTNSHQFGDGPILHPIDLVAAESSSFVSASAHPHSSNSSVHSGSIPIPSFVGYPGLPYIPHPSVGQVAATTVAQMVGDLHSGPLGQLAAAEAQIQDEDPALTFITNIPPSPPYYATWRSLHAALPIVWKIAKISRYYALSQILHSVGWWPKDAFTPVAIARSALLLVEGYYVELVALKNSLGDNSLSLPEIEMIYTNESILTLVVKRIDKYFRELGEMADAVILPHGAPSLKDSRKAYGIFSRENLATEPLPSDVSARAQHLLRNNRFIDTYDDDGNVTGLCNNKIIFSILGQFFYLREGSLARVMWILYDRYPALMGHQILPWRNNLPINTFIITCCAAKNSILSSTRGFVVKRPFNCENLWLDFQQLRFEIFNDPVRKAALITVCETAAVGWSNKIPIAALPQHWNEEDVVSGDDD